ncbi:spermidine synthase [Actinobaculum massiliense]|uniref:spermidine synthase n=1 Tax=Actinobaculum massiliense TaxID=202789 RepID=UPI00071AF523|nr:fused MFS/spermidine synthase [Actinobaculum massiliense]
MAVTKLPDGPVRTDFSIAELERYRDCPSLVTLYLSGVESSAIDLADPSFLDFEYMQQFRCVLDAAFPPRDSLKILHLGAAACAFARAVDAQRPNSRQLAVEIDSKLATYAREWFDLPPSPRLRIRVDDARRTLDTTKASWNVIIRDAFTNLDVPGPLRTVEAARRASESLAPGGLYLLNSVASAGLEQLGQEAGALLESFENLCAVTDPAILRGRRFGNIVLVASNSELPLPEIERSIRRLPMPTRVIYQKDLAARARATFPVHDSQVGVGKAKPSPPRGGPCDAGIVIRHAPDRRCPHRFRNDPARFRRTHLP